MMTRYEIDVKSLNLINKGRQKKTLTFFFLCFVGILIALMTTSCSSGGGGIPEMGQANPGQLRDSTPVVLEPSAPGIRTAGNNTALLDYSNTSDGYISVFANSSGSKIKVLINHPATQNQYNYTIQGPGVAVIPLSEGDGTYSVSLFENVFSDQYAQIAATNIDVALSDPTLPFLVPNQIVNFTYGDAATTLSQSLVEGATSDIEALGGVYGFVIDNIAYDYDEAVNVASGYLPDNTDTLSLKKGICFDYAALTASMLRAQGIPCKLVVGYAGQAYHAWIMAYPKDSGQILIYQFNGSEFVRMDPTFDAASRNSGQDLSSIIGDGSNYTPMFYY